MENMNIYEQARLVPDEAKKTIRAGRLKGFTDVNPMWRIKRLTELFGPCGIGWKYEPIHRDIQTFCGETCVFVDIMLYVIDPETGHWSEGIYGTGGSKLVATEKNGPYVSDEAFKMAQTDALSVACKNLGIGADVYFDKDRTKYTAATEEPQVNEDTDATEEPQVEEKATDAEKRRLWAMAKDAGINAKEFFIAHGATYDGLTAAQYVIMVRELQDNEAWAQMEQEDA